MHDFTLTARSERLLGLGDVLEHIAQATVSPLAAAKARTPHFFAEASAAREQLARIDEARHLAEGSDALVISPLADVTGALARAQRGAALELEELGFCLLLGQETLRLRRWAAAQRARAPQLWLHLAKVPQLETITAILDDALDERGGLRDEASAGLREARARAHALATRLRQDASDIMQSEQVAPLLMDSFVSVRNGRFVLPVNASYQAKVPGIVHNASQTGQTLFVEPLELIARGNELTLAEAEVEVQELAVRRALASEIAHSRQALADAQALLVELDVIVATARTAAELALVAPEIVDDHRAQDAALLLPALSHPRLLLTHGTVMRSDVLLRAPGQIMLISGPNAGGKTVLLASVALAMSMARMGLPLATGSRAQVPWLTRISCAWGDGQSLVRGLSSFAAQLEALADMISQAAPNQLLIIDELGGDTDPAEGAALAQAVLEHLAERGVWALVTTHLDALRALPLTDSRFVTARMATEADGVTPAFRLEQGAIGSSLALKLAERAGLDPKVLARAHALRAEGGLLAQALEQLEAQRQAVQAEKETLAQARQALEREARAAEEAARAAAQTAAQAHAAALAAHRAQLAGEAQALSQLIAELRERGERPAAQRALAALERDLAASAPSEVPEARGPVPRGLAAGQMVRVRPLGQVGEVVDVDEAAGLIELKLGAMRSRVRLDEVEPVAHGRPRAPAVKVQLDTPHAGPGGGGPVGAGLPGRCDVRGLRLHEALAALGRALDHGLAEGVGLLLVVHGHGPLRDEIRRTLSRSPYVGSHRPGDSHEGGDGVTLVQLDRG